MALQLPTHRVDAPITYVSLNDPCWDWERVDDEIKAAAEDPPSGAPGADIHPVHRYFAGVSRYDLDAPFHWRGGVCRASDYFREGEPPWLFQLRRLSYRELAAFKDAMQRGPETAAVDLCRLVLERIDGPGAPELRRANGRLTDRDMEMLHSLDHELAGNCGSAAYRASQTLTDAEKKS